MNLFEMLICELKEDITLINDAEEMKTLIKRELKLDDLHFKSINSRRLKLLVSAMDRQSTIDKIRDINGFEYDPDMKGSSIGGFHYKKATLLIVLVGKKLSFTSEYVTLIHQ